MDKFDYEISECTRSIGIHLMRHTCTYDECYTRKIIKFENIEWRNISYITLRWRIYKQIYKFLLKLKHLKGLYVFNPQCVLYAYNPQCVLYAYNSKLFKHKLLKSISKTRRVHCISSSIIFIL